MAIPSPRQGRTRGSNAAGRQREGRDAGLAVELLVTALTGAQMGFEASPFFFDDGDKPRIGQAFLAIDPSTLAGSGFCNGRIEALLTAMLADTGARVPGCRRLALRHRASGR